MRHKTILLLATLAMNTAGSCIADESKIKADIRNYEAAGNLESKYALGCVSHDKLKNTYSPADLYKSVTACVKQGKNKDAALIFVLAGTYGRFDTLRVEDKSAHQAVSVLKMQFFSSLTSEQQQIFKEELQKEIASSEEVASKCKVISRLGPPNYHPSYMIQHGMGAFTTDGGGNGLVKQFDAKTAWKYSLETYLHCSDI